MAERERLASLISGAGTTMAEIVKACKSGEIPMDVACVIASKRSAGGIDKALDLGINAKDILVINPLEYRTEDGRRDSTAFGEALLTEFKKRNVTVVTQNGWIPLTPKSVVQEYEGRIFMQHPGPVPEFGGQGMYGRRVHAAVLLFRRMANEEMWTEVTGQRVALGLDEGSVVKSARVEILPTDTIDDLQARALPTEHIVQIEMLKDFVSGELQEVKRQDVIVKPGQAEMLVQAKKIATLLYPKG